MFKAVLIGTVIVLSCSACSKLMPKLDNVVQDNRKEYRKSVSLPDLEVPPDLSTEAIRDRMAIPEGGEAARYSTYQERRADRERQEEVERSQTSAIRVLEDEHVVAVDGAPVQIWPRLRTFWGDLGYTLELDDVDLGVIETAWVKDASELERTKFKVFAEPDEAAGTTVLYVSHESEELTPLGEELVWQRADRDAELERSVVDRLQQVLSGATFEETAVATSAPVRRTQPAAPMGPLTGPGGYTVGDSQPEAPEAAPAPAPGTIGSPAPEMTGPRHAELVSVGGGKVYLTVDQDFPTAWKTTGRALEKAGVDVRDADKGRGVYVVKLAGEGGAAEDPGVWKKLKFWDRNKVPEYQVSLTGVGAKTEVVVLDKDGRWETGGHAGEILSKLHDALNSGRI